MCFYIDNNNRKRLAKRDIICYKNVRADLRPEYDYTGGFQYKLNKLFNHSKKKDILKVIHYILGVRIDIGFHFYIKESSHCYLTIVRCIIPKDAYYYKNKTEYVSDKIKIIEILK